MKQKDVKDKLNFTESFVEGSKNGGLLAMMPDTSLQYFPSARYKEIDWDSLSGYVFFAKNEDLVQYGFLLSDSDYKVSEISQNCSETKKVADPTQKAESSLSRNYSMSAKQIQSVRSAILREHVSDELFNALMNAVSDLSNGETIKDVDALIKETQSLSGAEPFLVVLFLSQYGKVLHTHNPENTRLRCNLDEAIRSMHRNQSLSPPTSLDLERATVSQGVKGETNVSQSENACATSKGKNVMSDQSDGDFGIDLKGVKLDFDTKTDPKKGMGGRKYDVSAPFKHKRATCTVYYVNMTGQPQEAWYLTHEYHNHQLNDIADQLQSLGKEVPYYMRSLTEPGLRKDDRGDTFRRNREGYKVCTNSLVLRVADGGFTVDQHFKHMWNF